MRVLVTGATGFLGAHVCRVLSAAGHRSIATLRSRSDPWRLAALAPSAERLVLDITDGAAVGEALASARPDVVVNAAGYGVNYDEQDPGLALATNVLSALNVARAAERAGARLIQIGSSYEVGSTGAPIAEDAHLCPKGLYGTTKAAGSLLIAEHAKATGLPSTILRLFSMYGPLEGRHKIVPAAMRALRTGTPLPLTPGGQVRDYVYVGDAARAVLACVEVGPPEPGLVVNIASGRAITLRELLTAAAGDTPLLQWGARPYRPDELMTVVGRPERAAKLLRWEASTLLPDGMAETRRFDDQRPEGC